LQLPRVTKPKSERQREQRELAAAEQALARARLDLAALRASEEAALRDADAELDGREFENGQPIPGRAVPTGSPLDGLKREADRLDAIAAKMAERVKFAGDNVRANALRNVECAETEAYEARLRFSEADGLARDYGGLAPCANPDCSNETPRSADYDTFGYCRACWNLIPKGA
jgi:hypothetical protein